MRWEDERYIRWYARNTPEWLFMSWQARGLFGLILRELDRAGILVTGKLGLRAVAVIVRAPWEEIEKPLAELLEDGCLIFREDLKLIVAPNFLEAQEAVQSDRARQRTHRERARDLARARSLGVPVDSRFVTEGDATGDRGVTESSVNGRNGHSVLSRAVPIHTNLPTPPISVRGGRAQAKPDDTSPEAQRADASTIESKPPVHGYDLALECYSAAFRKRYRRDFVLTSVHGIHSDDYAFTRIGRLAIEKAGEDGARALVEHWMRSYLKDDDRWLVENVHPPRALEKRLNKYGEPKKPKALAPKEPTPTPEKPRPVTILQPVTEAPPVRRESTAEELAEKARADKARLEATFGKDNS